MLIVDLPREILVNVLVDWLDISSCCRLDSAFCVHGARSSVLDALRDRTCGIIDRNAGTVVSRAALEWLWKRQIGVESIIIPPSLKSWQLDYDIFCAYLKTKGIKLLKLGETHFDEKDYGFFGQVPTYMNSTQLSTILSFCPNLVEVNDLSTECITLVSMGAMRRHCKNLRVLSIQHHEFDNWDPTPLIALVAGGDCGLTSLRLPSIQRYVGKFAIIARNLSQLQHLCFDRLRDITVCENDDKTFIAIAQHCTKLESLRLPMMRIVGDSSLIALSHGCRQLRTLDVSHCNRITSAGLKLLARSCTQLEYVHLAQCQAVDDGGIVALAKHCKANIRQLNLQQLSLLTDESLTALGAHCPSLTDLDVSYCELLRSTGVQAVAEGCPQLTRLELSCCHALSAQGIQAVAAHCAKLRHIGLRSVAWLEDAAVKGLLEGCPLLRQGGVALNGCMKISPAYRDKLGDEGVLCYS
jgi:N-acetylglutamate synthase-like GNAT family acetyltransferase